MNLDSILKSRDITLPKKIPTVKAFIGTNDAEAEAPILCPSAAKRRHTGEKTPDAGKDLRQEDRGEHEMFGWHHRLNGPEYEQTLRDGEGQESLASCGPWAAGVGHD